MLRRLKEFSFICRRVDSCLDPPIHQIPEMLFPVYVWYNWRPWQEGVSTKACWVRCIQEGEHEAVKYLQRRSEQWDAIGPVLVDRCGYNWCPSYHQSPTIERRSVINAVLDIHTSFSLRKSLFSFCNRKWNSSLNQTRLQSRWRVHWKPLDGSVLARVLGSQNPATCRRFYAVWSEIRRLPENTRTVEEGGINRFQKWRMIVPLAALKCHATAAWDCLALQTPDVIKFLWYPSNFD